MKKCTLYWHRESDGMMDGGEQNTKDVIGRYLHIICESSYISKNVLAIHYNIASLYCVWNPSNPISIMNKSLLGRVLHICLFFSCRRRRIECIWKTTNLQAGVRNQFLKQFQKQYRIKIYKVSEDARPRLRPNQREWKYRDGHQRG